MQEILIDFFRIIPPELATVIIAALPFVELQGSIPIAIAAYRIDVLTAYVLSVFGSVIPSYLMLWLLGPISGYLMQRSKLAHSFFEWLFNRTRHKFSGKYEKWGYLALTLWTAVPLPGAGVWSGTVAAFLFGIPKKNAMFFITLGSAIAGLLVTLVTTGVIHFF